MLPVFSDNTQWKCDESSPKWREDCNKVEGWERFNPIHAFDWSVDANPQLSLVDWTISLTLHQGVIQTLW